MRTETYDLVVVGGGSGGYAAARTAHDLGAHVAIVDHGPLGGLCILRGCMPSKTLLASSDLAHEVREAGRLGVRTTATGFDMPFIAARKREIVAGFQAYRVEGLERFALHVGPARFLSPGSLAVGDDLVLHAKNFIVATGSIVTPPQIPGLAQAGFFDSDQALERETVPESLVVLGGGYVGCELGQFFARGGARTTLVMRAAHAISAADTDVGTALTNAMRAEGIVVETHAKVESVSIDGREKVVHFTQGTHRGEARGTEIFLALGRMPNCGALDLEKAGVEGHAMTGIVVGDDLRTTNPHVFAVGDVTGKFPLVHVAIHQGEVAARNAVGGGSEQADYALVAASAVYTDPQLAVAGASEKDLRKRGEPYLVASYPFDDHGKAIAMGKTLGFVKVLCAPESGRILGAACVGAFASDLIHEMIVAVQLRASVADLARIPHLHPTMAEIWTYPLEELAAAVRAKTAAAA